MTPGSSLRSRRTVLCCTCAFSSNLLQMTHDLSSPWARRIKVFLCVALDLRLTVLAAFNLMRARERLLLSPHGPSMLVWTERKQACSWTAGRPPQQKFQRTAARGPGSECKNFE